MISLTLVSNDESAATLAEVSVDNAASIDELAEVLEEKTDSYGNIWVRIGLNQWSAMKYYNNIYLEYLEK